MKLIPQLLQATLRCLARHEGQAEDRPLLAAVSGGVDSSVLGFVLGSLRAAGRLPNEVVLAHVDHGVWDGSERGHAAVEQQAALLGVGFLGRRLEAPGRSEQALRQARYQALEAMARECGARTVLTGHHADDNLETILFRMLRGTGPRGLAGIPEARRLGRDLQVVRPFLNTRRYTLQTAWERANQDRTKRALTPLPLVEDPTNKDLGYSRNQLRHEVIPQLRETLGIRLDASLFALARSARATADVLEVQAGRLLRSAARFPVPWRCELQLRSLDQSDRPFFNEALVQIHQRLDPNHRVPGWRWVERVWDLLSQPQGHRVAGPESLLVEKTRDGLLVLDPRRAGDPPDTSLCFLPRPSAGRVRFGSTEWSVRASSHDEPPLSPSPTVTGPRRAVLDPSGWAWPWQLRRRCRGDRFQPLGQDREISLRRFLMKRHVARFDRDRLPLVVDAKGRVLWVPGVEISERARLTLDTSQCIELQLVAG